nr:cytochrome P450 CYP4NQ24 [Monolepta hieroglyphica]
MMAFIIIFVITLIVLLLATCYLYVVRRRNSRYMRNVPGPEPNLFLGNLIDFVFVPTYKYLDKLNHYLQTYGRIIKFHDGPLRLVAVVTDAKFFEHILSSTTFIDKADHYDYLHGWLGEGLLVSTGTKWRKRRRTLTPSFHFSILENFVDVFENVGENFVKILEGETGKHSVDICELVSMCTLDIICEASMGTTLNALNDKTSPYVRNSKTMGAIVSQRITSALPTWLYPFTFRYWLEKRALSVIHAYTDDIIDKRIAEKAETLQGNDSTVNDTGLKKKLAFLDLLLTCTIDGQPLSKADLREEVNTFMYEGHDTTSAAISFALFSLATNPHIQEEAVREQQEIYDDWKNAKTSIAALNKMKYLELVIKETLRLYPSVPFIGRRLSEDLNWEGNLYEKGTNVLLSTFAMHRDPLYFPDPLEFMPERFQDANLINPYVYTPFSAGPRNCIGQKFAMLEMKSTISKVLRNFQLLPATPTHELQLAPEIVIVSKNGIRISLKRRTF